MSERKRKDGADATVIEWVPRPAEGPSGPGQPASGPSVRANIVLVVCGVLFPAAVILIELSARLCAEAFFDPMPTPAHVALVAMVPLVNLLGLLRLNDKASGPAWLARALPVLLGASLAVAAFYALLFLPLLPLAVMAVLYHGLGLLPFGPLAGFLTLLAVRARLAKRKGEEEWSARKTMAGFALGIVALVGPDIPSAMTRLGLQWAVSADTAERERGLSLLRTLGDRDELLRLAYDTGGRTGGPLSLLIGAGGQALLEPGRRTAVRSPAEVREVFYRAYGIPFNALPPPHTGRQWSRFEDFAFDADHGGAEVGGRIKGLDLLSSRMDGSLSGDDAAGYLEWILEFRNTSSLDREARLTIALPPGGVVSRATLWVNGEEREAAYGGRAEVRKAYEQVAVRQRRDPLLVTTKGADRVLAQAFPVPRRGTLKFKIGITAPLDLSSRERGTLVMPSIIDRNFSIAEDLTHAVWIESRTALESGSAALRQGSAGRAGFRLEGVLSDKELATRRPQIHAARDRDVRHRIARADDAPAIAQEIVERPAAADPSLLLLVDGSERVGPHAASVASVLESLPAAARVGVLIAAEPMVRMEPAPWTGEHRSRVLAALREHGFAGGQDNTPAFAQALKMADQEPDARLLWVHGPQPVRFSKTAGLLEQAAARITRLPDIDLYAIAPGPNELLPDAPWAWGARLLPAHGNVTDDLRRYLTSVFGSAPVPAVERMPVVETGAKAEATGSQHIVRLWARDKVIRMILADPAGNHQRAVELASAHRLVTPVSGAVVLETQAQYEANGLSPAGQATVPTVPEPHEWALILIAGLVLIFLFGRRKAEWGGAA